MNQILFTKKMLEYNIKNKENKKKYIIIFLFSCSILFIFLVYALFCFFIKEYKKKSTNLLLEKYNISAIYSYKSSSFFIEVSDNVYIIGLIEIPSISIKYPILSNCTDELLKISICKFSGSLPNNIGNMCLAGHNYKNNSMFSKLHTLNIGDSIYITDLNGNKLEYNIYDKIKISQNDWSYIKNSNEMEITLMTCNSTNNKERLIIKAKVKG